MNTAVQNELLNPLDCNITYLVWPTRTNSYFDRSLSEFKVMAEVWFWRFSTNSFYQIAKRCNGKGVITTESNKIDWKSLLGVLVQTVIYVTQAKYNDK